MPLSVSPNHAIFTPILSNFGIKKNSPVIVHNYLGVPVLTKYINKKNVFLCPELRLNFDFYPNFHPLYHPKNITIDVEAFLQKFKYIKKIL